MISIIVPVYNSATYLERCVNSLIQQTMDEIEIILVDDGSTDGSSGICDKFSAVDKRVCVIHQPNSGVSIARNRGLAAAKGEYISFVDSDDYVDSDYIQAMYNGIVNNDSDLVICGRTQIKIDGSRNVITPPALQMNCDKIKEIFQNTGFDYVRGGPCCKMYKKSIIDHYNIYFPENIHYLEDAIFVLEYILCCSRVVSIKESHYFYELHAGSLVFSVHSLQSELCGYNGFKAVYHKYIDKFGLSTDDSYWFISNLNFMLYRQLKAISEQPIKAKIENYKKINWSDYREFSSHRGIKSIVINYMTCFNLGRLLLSMINVI